MPKISVVVPIFNVAKYLPQCLESLINQTLKEIEIICVNDGSTDNSLDIINQFAEKDHRIKVISTENFGYGHAMNTGFAAASGDYVGILESDDFTASNMYEALYQTAVFNNADIVKSNYWDYRNGNKELVKSLLEGPYNKVFCPRQEAMELFACNSSIWSAIYKREFIVKNAIKFNETPGASYQDTSFNFIALACAERMVLKEDAYICYRRDNEASSVNSGKKVYCVFDEYNFIEEYLSSRDNLHSEVKYLLPALGWNTYRWNYGRIAMEFKYEFLKKMIEYFYNAFEEGKINPTYWLNKDQLKEAMHILADRNTFLYRVYAEIQKREALLGNLKYKVQNSDKVYIYGAGKVGCEIATLLDKQELNFDGFVVTNGAAKYDEVIGKQVMDLADIEKMSVGDNTLFLVSVKESTQPDIMLVLHEKGFYNIIPMTNELRKYLVAFEHYDLGMLVKELITKS